MLEELEVFADTVRRGEAPMDNLETSTQTMRLYDAIKHSVESGGDIQTLR